MKSLGLLLLGSAFSAGVYGRNVLYDRGIFRTRKLRGPVVSVGNLSVGGSGKTPFVLRIGAVLKSRKVRFDVLSRGYGRKTRGVALVNPGGSASEFGDEPLLIARKLEIPVVVGEDRFEAGRFAEEHFGPQLHILDDGFQHRSLARDFDIVLVTAEDTRDRLLPLGRMREPLSSLRRADAIVLTSGAPRESFPVDGKLVWRARRGIVPRRVPDRAVAFCGIARPQNFFRQLRTAGIHPVAEAVYRDHHPYTPRDIAELLDLRHRSEADGFVTTEKDAINLGERLGELGMVSVIPARMRLEDPGDVVETILRVIEERRHEA
jgi:tetraacyldisaccharide 4'-kinase